MDYINKQLYENVYFHKSKFKKCNNASEIAIYETTHKKKENIKEGVDKVKVEGTVYEDALQQVEVMNKSFHTVFTR